MKREVWNNFENYHPDDYRDAFHETFGREPCEPELESFVDTLLWDYLNEDAANIECHIRHALADDYSQIEFIGVADIGLWNGRRKGYKIYKTFFDLMKLEDDCLYGKFFVDGDNFSSSQHHHDGSIDITYYYVKKEDLDNFEAEFYYSEVYEKPEEYSEKYLHPLGKLVADTFGWE